MRHSSKSISFSMVSGLKRRKHDEIQSLTVQRKDKIVMIMKIKKRRRRRTKNVFFLFAFSSLVLVKSKEKK